MPANEAHLTIGGFVNELGRGMEPWLTSALQ